MKDIEKIEEEIQYLLNFDLNNSRYYKKKKRFNALLTDIGIYHDKLRDELHLSGASKICLLYREWELNSKLDYDVFIKQRVEDFENKYKLKLSIQDDCQTIIVEEL